MQRSFYLVMMIFIALLILFGFSHTVEGVIVHTAEPPPAVLYLHAAVFGGWLVVLVTQALLIWTRNPRLHRKLGWFGLGIAVLMVGVGFATTVIMGHAHLLREGPAAAMFMYRPFEDITFFAAAFGLAVYWRKRPDIHRRLMLLAAIALTPPAISRIPGLPTLSTVYAGTDLLLVIAIIHDLVTTRRIHAAYRWGTAIAIVGQVALLAVMSLRPAPFFNLAVAIAR